MIKNHPEEDISVAFPVVDKTDKFQRSVVKTVVFKKEKNTVQGTFVLDQRTKNVVELDYQVLPQTPKVFVEILVKPIIRTYTTVTTIKKVFTTNTFVMSTISTVSSIDSTLESMTPTYVHYE